jgi:hypothetical protein
MKKIQEIPNGDNFSMAGAHLACSKYTPGSFLTVEVS